MPENLTHSCTSLDESLFSRFVPTMPTLGWMGQDAVVRHHKKVPFRLLEPDKKLSHGDSALGNLILEGDNLHALKALLPRYAWKLKCI